MASKKGKKSALLSTDVTIADNRKANFDYFLEEKIEAGIMLTGTEVKSLRHGQCGLQESHIAPKNGEFYLLNAHIPEYQQAGPHLQHAPRRPRKLLLHARQRNRLFGAVSRDGYTIVPTRIFFNEKGLAKVEIALAKGKKEYDKRETIKQRDWDRQKHRVMRNDRGE
ncbi:MAG: SsrA-binding protein [Micavibrio aeruginosavorus]|uniref:SsrA-binding protein n=1 Tax=Micavibrio aeruginosavorus TaxID=349221 RepID=A0A2W4ZZG2_9BACT|nr:MAG: SsrA-binding protein [Micavibrio aeruginosavorus]